MRRALDKITIAAALVLASAVTSSAADESRFYATKASAACDGMPRIDIGVTRGMCAGLVVGSEPGASFARRTLKLPRTLLQTAADEWLVSDLGDWAPGRGSVWKLTVQPREPTKMHRVLGGLDMPHTLAVGPDGGVYLGEMGRIIRFDPRSSDPSSTVRIVVSGLPDNRLHDNRHPLSSFIFDADGALLVNVGAPSDQCAQAVGKRCAEIEGAEPAAVVRRYAYLGAGRWSDKPEVFARGLRNSLALVRAPSGLLLQAENSIDLDARWSPHDEINVLERGKHYGWPYCMDRDAAAPAWSAAKAMSCGEGAHAKPAVMLPPHAAPLALAYYDGVMFPQLQGKLLVTFHGYRSVGARLVAYATDRSGRPITGKSARFAYSGAGGAVSHRAFPAALAGYVAEPQVITTGWDAKAGVRPRGWPVGVTVSRDGSIWLADDRNGAIVRLAKDQP